MGTATLTRSRKTAKPKSATAPKTRPALQLICSTLAEVADAFGITAQVARQWRCESPPMPGAPGRFDLKEIIQWRFPKIHGRPATPESSASKQLSNDLAEVKLERLRMELAQDQGKLVELASVELTFAQALIKCRCQIMTIPEAIATSAPPEVRDHARAEADRTCRAALTTLRRELESPKFVEEGEVKS